MTLLRRAPNPAAHRCQPPIERTTFGRLPSEGLGSIWRCDECGARWQVVRKAGPAYASDRFNRRWVRRYWPWPR